jgi:hypothetical protein
MAHKSFMMAPGHILYSFIESSSTGFTSFLPPNYMGLTNLNG